ncbi:MAG: prepilin-type N-terminal cleavage/methylation domain-containing protein [Planctomycetota bacterium]|jgi:prepilin-type N-terminal cleavage/methylation domain-containing protein
MGTKKRRGAKTSGFSLIEILIVMGVLGFLAAVFTI